MRKDEKKNGVMVKNMCGHGDYGKNGPLLYHPCSILQHWQSLHVRISINYIEDGEVFLGKANILVLRPSLTKISKLLEFPVTNIYRK